MDDEKKWPSVAEHALSAAELGTKMHLDIETRSADIGLDDQLLFYSYMLEGDEKPTTVRFTYPTLRDYHASEFMTGGEGGTYTTTLGPDARLDDGTMIDYKTIIDRAMGTDCGQEDVLVVVGGDLLHGDFGPTERRILSHMVSDAQFENFQKKYAEVVDTFREVELKPKRESLRDAMLVQACKYLADTPRPDKPKRDWEKRNKKQRRR